MGKFCDSRLWLAGVEMLECFCNLAVRSGSTRRTQALVQGALDERVREVVAPRHVGHFLHQRRRARRVEDVQQLILGCGGSGREHVEVEVPADHRRQRQHPLGLRSQSPDTRPDDHQHRVGQCGEFERAGQRPPAIGILDDHLGLGQVTQQFGDEERIPVGLSMDRLGKA